MDAEMPDVFSSNKVKANKDHICYECRHKIEKGIYYWRMKGHWPGGIDWQTYKICEECEEIRQELADPDYGLAPFGYLSDWVQESEQQIINAKINNVCFK